MAKRRTALAGQAGFSMIEMLMAAFILAVGLLGLCMLQTLSLRASGGSRNLITGTQVADREMDQVELQGRLSWLNITNSSSGAPALTDLGAANTNYLTLALNTPSAPARSYNIQGGVIDASSADPRLRTPYFSATVTRIQDVGNAGGTGQMSDFTVRVTFQDAVNGQNLPILRQVSLTRRILHG